MTTRVLVLGASGFLGRHVIRRLAEAGGIEPVAGWHRHPPVERAGITRVRLDASSEKALAGTLSTVDAVVNCVAGAPETIARSGRALFRAAAAITPAPRIVHMSSMAVYGSQSGILNEDAPLLGDVGGYSEAKVAVEEAARGYPRSICLRPGCIYGPGSTQWSERIAKLIRAGRLGDLGAAGDGYSNLVHVDDVVAAIIAALGAPDAPARAYNLAAQPRLRWNDYFIAYAKALGAVPVRRISRRQLKLESKLVAPALKVADIVAQRVRPGNHWVPELIPPSLARLWMQEIHLDSSRAERELGLRLTPLADGLASTLSAARDPAGASRT